MLALPRQSASWRTPCRRPFVIIRYPSQIGLLFSMRGRSASSLGFLARKSRDLIASGIVPAARSLAGRPVWPTEEVRRALAGHFGFDRIERQRQHRAALQKRLWMQSTLFPGRREIRARGHVDYTTAETVSELL